MNRISISSPQEVVAIDRSRILKAADTVLRGEGVTSSEISVAFVDSGTIRQLNQRYLKHDEPTDVLSFPLSDSKKKLLGELVIGAEVGLGQAESRGHDVQTELALYVIHGLLHLCGYDDATEREASEMRERERHYLRELGLPDIAPSAEE
jgi:probable rRNA maturation factor